MWSLPDIKRLNSDQTSAQLNRQRLEQAVVTGVLDGSPLRCEYGKKCLAELSHQLWFDVFSDDPRGIITQCEFHRVRYGRPEGFFWCGLCHRLMVENCTWEIYTVGEYGGRLCLRCAAEEYIGNENNWIALTDEDIAVVTFDTLRQARHVLGVSMPVPKQIQLFDSLTLDSSSGGLVRGFSYADPRPEAAAEALRAILNQAQNADQDRALLIIDGAYQFAFSIGVYVSAAMGPKQQTDGGGSQ